MCKGQLATPDDAITYMKAGNATMTFTSLKSGNHFTYKIKRKEVGENTYIYFVKVLSGPNNEDHYQYIGFIDKFGKFKPGKKGHPDSTSFKSFEWVYRNIENQHLPANVQIQHEGRCGRCNRKLTHPESIKRGIGPECAKKVFG